MLLPLFVAAAIAGTTLEKENEAYGVKLPPIQVNVLEWTSNRKPYLFRVTKVDANPKVKARPSKDRKFVQCEVEFVSNIERVTNASFGLAHFSLYDDRMEPYPAVAVASTVPDARTYVELQPTQAVSYLVGFEIPKDAKPSKLCYQHGWQRTIFVDLAQRAVVGGLQGGATDPTRTPRPPDRPAQARPAVGAAEKP